MKQLIMPPFVPIEIPSGGGHNSEEQGAVALGLGPDIKVAMVRQRGKGIEFRAHVERPAVPVHERQINGNAAGMGRSAPRVSQKLGVRGMRPQCPLRFARTQGIEDPKAKTEHPRQLYRAIECRQGIAMKQTSRRSIDRFASEITLGRIGKIDIDISARAGNFNEIHGCGSGFASVQRIAPV